MTARLVRRLYLPATVCLLVSAVASADELADRLKTARPGDTITLPAGTFRGGVTLPEGVSLKGAAYAQTILDATGADNGLVLSGKTPVSVSDLTVRGAAQAGIVADGLAGGAVERVVVRGCGSGLVVRDTRGLQVRNVVLADNAAGVALVRSEGCALVNATVANVAGTAIRVSGCRRTAVFNNLVANAAYGIVVTADRSDLAIDHNLYIANYVGQLQGETTRKKVESWAALSGYDRHSLTIGVSFKDAASGDYRPISRLSWAPVRATSSDWGVPKLGAVEAPAADMDGVRRAGGVDLGAHEVSFPALRPADGTLTVKSGAGVTSAGLFTPDGRLVRYLFQNLPLPAGRHEFWLPSRDWQGRPIPTGAYEVRTVEADLRLDYVAAAGNGDLAMSTTELGGVAKRVSLDPHAAAFDAAGQLLVAQSGFESGQFVRAYDPAMTRFVWSFPGGGHTQGMAVDGRGRVLVLRKGGSLVRLDAATGLGAPFASGSIEKPLGDAVKSINGLCVAGEKVYVGDPEAGQLVVLAGDELARAGSVAVPSPTQPSHDPASGLIWSIAAEKDLVTVAPDGAVTARGAPVEKPTVLAARDKRLAVYSAKANTIAVFDASDPANLKPIRTIGKGGDGYGPIEGDRFWGVKAMAWSAQGELAVVDGIRTVLFAADGSVKRHHMGMWGQGISCGTFAGDDRMHFFNIGGGYSIILDAKKRRWEPGTRWRYTMELGNPYFVFPAGGKTYGLFPQTVKGEGEYLGVVRMEADGTGRVMRRYGWDKEGLFVQRDADGDGVIAAADPQEPVLGTDGKRLADRFMDRGFWNIDFRADGMIVHPARAGVQLVKRSGLDAQGVPQYDFAGARFLRGTTEGESAEYVSPYDFQTKETLSIAEDMFLNADGTYAAVVTTKSGPGPDMCTEHANGTSMAGFDATGRLRWLWALNPYGLKMGFYGITTIGGITLAGRGAICEYESMDADGLGTGVLGMPREFGWPGMWLDNHRQSVGFTGNDGRPYLVVGDYAQQAYHWLELKGADAVQRRKQALRVTDALAAALAAEPAQPVPVWPVPPPPRVTIPRLAAPLPMDGDPAKWRGLGLKPFVAIGDDPLSSAAVMRLAYQGDDLYVQVIKFDDVLTFHQREPGKHYLQDGIEFCVNTFMEGWKYNLTRMEGKDVVLRDRWGGGRLLTPEEAPRSITVHETAAGVEERRLVEAATGADLSKCRAAVFEFKLTKAALSELPAKRQVNLASGQTFLFGFMINDNDLPGADTLNPMVWPVTYGTFERDDRSATAVLE
jgi:nitrous oxidase accessory protein NosD